MGIVEDTQKVLNEAREKSESIIVSFSGGKDSSATALLCMRTFKVVKFAFMYFIPGLEVVEELIARWQKQWGVEIMQVPHWALSRKLRNDVYTFPPGYVIDEEFPGGILVEATDIAEHSLDDTYDLLIADTGIPLIATGAKKSDSMWRRRMMGTWGNQERLIYPLRNWNKLDVLHFLKANRVPLPDSSGKNANGIDLSTPSVLWLYDNHRADYEKVRAVFPLVDAVIWRRNFFGIGAEFYGNEEVRKAKRAAVAKH